MKLSHASNIRQPPSLSRAFDVQAYQDKDAYVKHVKAQAADSQCTKSMEIWRDEMQKQHAVVQIN